MSSEHNNSINIISQFTVGELLWWSKLHPGQCTVYFGDLTLLSGLANIASKSHQRSLKAAKTQQNHLWPWFVARELMTLPQIHPGTRLCPQSKILDTPLSCSTWRAQESDWVTVSQYCNGNTGRRTHGYWEGVCPRLRPWAVFCNKMAMHARVNILQSA